MSIERILPAEHVLFSEKAAHALLVRCGIFLEDKQFSSL